MELSYYKYCVVPECKSTTIKTPNKLFIYVPNNIKIRKKWLTLARRNDAHKLSSDSRMHFCEDHFDLPNDIVNYMQYHIMGKVSQVRMKPGCIPTKFECQEDRRKRTCGSTERSCITKRKRMMTITECLKESEERCAQSQFRKGASEISFPKLEENIQENLSKHSEDKSVQVVIKPKFRSKAIQCEILSPGIIAFETVKVER
ncbi:unnamed protein product [Diatraea saccharalis]|uniref:THAP-type domain-containing protein n=1 Tax=Diatraea saccharalis TaxID=40085 RepID=A0A9N9R8C9_9NEOP|nr:unnamed protein product [Diatraea saccharalis]